ncbi:MAG: hypothetical protein HYZ28_01565 [Myxococcales bacterium]|nr:hypothetical protein [Myxococcales bacterium]
MEPTDLTIGILQEIRDEQRATRGELREVRGELHELRGDLRQAIERSDARFEVIETVLRDMAQQLVLLARGVIVALEARPSMEERLLEIERRLAELEKRQTH